MSIKKVLTLVEEIKEDEEDYYTELTVAGVEKITLSAALLEFPAREYISRIKGRLPEPQWFPLSAIRKMDDALYFRSDLAREKGLNARK